MLDLVIPGGLIVTLAEAGERDIGVQNGIMIVDHGRATG